MSVQIITPSREPSPRQARVLEFIRAQIVERGIPPTLAEITTHLGNRSVNAVCDLLDALERKGYITRLRRKQRGLRLTDRARAA